MKSLITIAARVAAQSAPSISFKGEIESGFDGENTGAHGTLTLDGVEFEMDLSGSGGQAEVSLNGDPVEDEALLFRIEEFFSEKWPEEDDSRWVASSTDDAYQTAEVSF